MPHDGIYIVIMYHPFRTMLRYPVPILLTIWFWPQGFNVVCLMIHQYLFGPFQNSNNQIYWAIFSIKFHPKPVDTLSAAFVQFHRAVSLLSHCHALVLHLRMIEIQALWRFWWASKFWLQIHQRRSQARWHMMGFHCWKQKSNPGFEWIWQSLTWINDQNSSEVVENWVPSCSTV